MTVDLEAVTREAIAELSRILPCSQCGKTIDQPACGFGHATLQADPTQHRLIAPLLVSLPDDRLAEAEAWQRGVLDLTDELKREPGERELKNPYLRGGGDVR